MVSVPLPVKKLSSSMMQDYDIVEMVFVNDMKIVMMEMTTELLVQNVLLDVILNEQQW
jgi:hypothetical protein